VADRLGAYVWNTLRKLDVIPPAPAAPNEERNAGEEESADGCCEAESCCASGEGDEGEYEPERSAAIPDAPGTRDAYAGRRAPDADAAATVGEGGLLCAPFASAKAGLTHAAWRSHPL
jgi:hypothetical protein